MTEYFPADCREGHVELIWHGPLDWSCDRCGWKSDPDCPWHHLPAGETVWVDVGGWKLPGTAELWCAARHVGASLRPAVDQALAAFDRMIEEGTWPSGRS